MADNRKNLERRLLAYSAAAAVVTAGAASALPAVALETDGARDNEFDIVLESGPPAALAQASTTSDCVIVLGNSATVFIYQNPYYASARVASFFATSSSFKVGGGSVNGVVRTSYFSFTGHSPSTVKSYYFAPFSDTTIPFLRVEFNRQTNQFCIYGFADPSAITGIAAQAGPAPQAAPTGLAAAAAMLLAGLSAAALWLRSKGRKSSSMP